MHLSLLPADTPLGAARAYYRLIRRLTPGERIARAFEMEEETQRLAEEGVRRRHPEYDPRQVWLAVARIRLGPELFRKAFPGVTVRP